VTPIRLPLAKPTFDDREVEAVRRVLASGWVVQGAEVAAFEAALATMHKAEHCVAVSSGTAALHICYLALGLGPGDAVFVPSFAWPSAANMAMVVGARPVLVDVRADTYNIDPADLRQRIQQCIEQKWGRPRAVVPVHEFGLPADVDAVLDLAKEFDMEVIEDAACALGAAHNGRPVGTFGCMGIFSFHPRKAITTGEGGAIVTNDDTLANACRMWRNHGQVLHADRRDFHVAGFNYRMTELQAAIGQAQLDKFPAILTKRQWIVSQYFGELHDCPGIHLPADGPEHTWQTFMVVLNEALKQQTVMDFLAAEGIGAGPGSVAAHSQEIYQRTFGYRSSHLPVAERLASWGLALPLYSEMTDGQVHMCADALKRAVEKHATTH
jgi:dTDP-4-amino-4,6-dideoxygalactose transaminase